MKNKIFALVHIVSTLGLIIILSFNDRGGVISAIGLIATMTTATLTGVFSVFRKSVWKVAQSNKANLLNSYKYFAALVVVVAVSGSISNDMGLIPYHFDYPKFLSWIIVYASVVLPSIVYLFSTVNKTQLTLD